MSEPSILILDIETFPQLQLRWRFWEKGRPVKTLRGNRVANVAYRWLGEPKKNTKVISQIDNPAWEADRLGVLGELDDEFVLTEIQKVILSADYVVAHYGDGFDRPMLERRMMFHRLGPLPKRNWIDSKKEFSKLTGGSGHSMALGEIAEEFGIGSKIETNISLWIDCMNGVKRAWKDMNKYAKHDVDLLHDIVVRFGPYWDTIINRGLWAPGEDVCTWCGSSDLMPRGWYRTKASEFRQFHCNNCGHWPRSAKRRPQTVKAFSDVRMR